MVDSILHRLTALENERRHDRALAQTTASGVQRLLDSAERRDVKISTLQSGVDTLAAKVNEMAPSVKVLRDGLIFVRWGRWIVGGVFGVLIAASGLLEWITTHGGALFRK